MQSLNYIILKGHLCLKVLSTTVATALQYDGNPETRETERFVRNFDKFFDLMNVRSLEEGIKKRKPNLLPYREITDDRLTVSVARYKFLFFNAFL